MSIETVVPARATSVFVDDVKAGQHWAFKAHGTWTDAFIKAGPKGYYNKLCALFGVWPVAPGNRVFELMGMIEGQPRTVFGIGDGIVHTIPTDGRLVVFANDVQGLYWNNRGALLLSSTLLEGEVREADSSPAETKGSEARPVRAWKTLLGDMIERAKVWKRSPSNHAAKRPSPFHEDWVAGVSWLWNLLIDTLNRTQGFLYILAVTLIVSLTLAVLPQGRDLVSAVVETRHFRNNHESLNGQAAGLCAAVAFLGVQAWFWMRRIIEANYGLNRASWGEARGFLTWAPRVVGASPLVIMAFTLVWTRMSGMVEDNRPLGGATLGCLLIFTVLFAAFVLFRTNVADRLKSSTLRIWGFFWPIGTLAVSIAALIWVCIDPVGPAQAVGSPAVVFFAAACTLPIMVLIIQLGQLMRAPLTILLLLWAIFCGYFNDCQHTIGRRAFKIPIAAALPQSLSAEQAFDRWAGSFSQAATGGKPIPVIVVASEGGASRAGYWTAVALDQLQKRAPDDFSHHVFAISSISGGSVGAVGWAASLHEDRPSDLLLQFAGKDVLSPTLAEMLFPDLLQRFIPFSLLPDRAEGIERGWEKAWGVACRAASDRSFCSDPNRIARAYGAIWADALKDPAERWRPLVFIGGAMEEDGRRITTAPVGLPRTLDSYDFYASQQHEIPASTAIHNGARFPWVSPAGRIPAIRPTSHVVDGGYFDASGVATAEELLTALRTHAASCRPSGLKTCPAFTFHLVVIRYCDAGANCPNNSLSANERPTQSSPTIRPARLAQDALAPLTGLSASRNGHQDHILTSASLDTGVERHMIVLRGYPCEGLPLNWVLSTKAREYIGTEAVRIKPAIFEFGGERVTIPPSTSHEIDEVARIVAQFGDRPLIPAAAPQHAFSCQAARRAR